MKTMRTVIISTCLLAAWLPLRALAQGAPPSGSQGGAPAGQAPPAAHDAAALAKKSQNPVSDLISLPFQSNWDYGLGPDRRTQYTLKIQPVIPMTLTENWNVVTRFIFPLTHVPIGPSDSQSGTGDATLSFFFGRRTESKVIVAVGPQFILPTASDSALGSGKASVGPTAVVLTTPGPWVVGALVSNSWSFAGDSTRRDVNFFSFQPFINYNVPKTRGFAIATSPIITADWKSPNDQRWVVPVGGGISQTFVAGKQPMSLGFALYYNAIRPDNAPNWNLRFTLSFLFPK